MNVNCMIDVETTGLEDHHEIIELAAVLFCNDFKERGHFCCLINAANHKRTFAVKAFEVNGFDMDQVRSHGISASNAKGELERWLIIRSVASNLIPVGHNIINFDLPKIKKFLFRNDPDFDKLFPARRVVDSKIIANGLNMTTPPRFKSTSLQALAKHFGIDPGRAHSALDDCRTNIKVLKRMLGK